MTLGKSFQSLSSSLIWAYLYHFLYVFGIIILLEHPTQEPVFWLMIYLFTWRIGDDPPSSLFHFQIHWQQNKTIGMMFLELKASSSNLHCLIHCRLAFWCFLVDSWHSWWVFSQQYVIVCIFFLLVAVTWLSHALYTYSFVTALKRLSWLVQINNALFQINTELLKRFHWSVCGWV